jgi:Mg-chelatase subunit ChlD
MVLTTPLWLGLLALLPLFIWLGWPARGPSRTREAISLAVRLLIVLLLIVSLAGPEIRSGGDRLAVIFLVDNSDSISALAKQVAQQMVREALQNLAPTDQAGVVIFGGDALVERPLSYSKDLDAFSTKVTPIQTDLAEAIRLGLALLPADAARRLVIISDGQETTGDAVEAAQFARASGAQIVVIPLVQTLGQADAQVSAVTAPAHLRQGEQFNLKVTVDSTVNQSVGVRVFAGAAVAYTGQLTLRKGTNRFELPLTAGTPGFANYRVQISPASDTLYQNNELSTFAQVAGPPKVLLVKNPAPRDNIDESKELVAALTASNMLIQVVPPTGLPSELASLSEYASVVLVDVPARDFTPRQMTALQTYVRDLGGGLVAVGGPSAFGVGGYFRTPLEETLPVEMQIKDQKRRARLALIFIIDHSGSMAETSGGATKVELAKEAVIRSIDLLSPMDKVGVIAFDDVASWVVNLAPLDNPDQVKNRVGTIRADGGTDIFAGVKAAAAVLPNDDATIKHIILLTDGGADPTGIQDLVTKLNKDDGITFSTVGVGADAAAFLPDLARAGNGLYHYAGNAAAIPTIFAEETTLATRAYIIEEEFFPQAARSHPIIQGITSVPKLLGYIGTTAKPAAQTILLSDQQDPILAAWQYGLGKSVAWTSDATGRWAKNWVSWEQFARFWAQAVRYTISDNAATNAAVTVNRSGEKAAVTVDLQSATGDYLNGLTMEAQVVAPDGLTQTVTLSQVAPGRYAGDFLPTTEGAYLLRVTGVDPAQPGAAQASVGQTAGWVLSYSPEYQLAPVTSGQLTPGSQLLLRLAQASGGYMLRSTSDNGLAYADLFKHDLTAPARPTQPIWPWLLTLAALLLPFDIAVRRLVVTRHDVRRAWQKAGAWLADRRPHLNPQPAPRTEQLSSLLQAKGRAQEAKDPAASAKPPMSAPATPGVPATKPLTPPPPSEPKPAARPPQPGEPSASTSAALLAAKKRAREKKD